MCTHKCVQLYIQVYTYIQNTVYTKRMYKVMYICLYVHTYKYITYTAIYIAQGGQSQTSVKITYIVSAGSSSLNT